MRPLFLARLSRAALEEARGLVRLDGTSTEVLKGPALRARRRRIDWSRHLVQAGFLLTVALVGWEFVRWVYGLVAACPVPRALRVETPAPWRRAVRPVATAALVVGLFLAGTLLARATGHWRSAITDDEFARRIRTIDSPAYAHDEGRVPSRAEWEKAERSAESPARP